MNSNNFSTQSRQSEITSENKHQDAHPTHNDADFASSIIEAMDDAVIVYASDGCIQFVSRRFSQITGFRAEALEGTRPPFPYWPEAKTEEALSIFHTSLSNASGLIEADYVTSAGEQIPVEINPSFLRKGEEITGLVCVIRTRSEYIRAREETEFLRMLMDVMLGHDDLAYWNFSLDGSGQTCHSDSYYRMLGYEPDAWNPSYEAWADKVHPDDIGEADRAVKAVMNGSSSRYFAEFRMKDADGNWRWIMSRGFVTRRDDDGLPLQITGTHQDIHDYKVQEQQALLAQKIDVLGHLTGGIAHDFNNLLSIITGNFQMMERCKEADRPVYAQRVTDALNRAGTLTNTLLSYARNEAVATEVVSVNHYLSRFANVFRAALNADIRLDLEFAPEDVRIELARGSLENAVLNLIINARDALSQLEENADSDRRIVVTTKIVPARLLSSALARSEAELFVAITVKDNGVGMDSATMARATEPLFSTKSEGEGTGLGLSTIHRLTRAAKGHLDIKSELGRGTEVSMYFPVLPVNALDDEADDDAGTDRFPGGTEKLLIIDDEAGLLDLLGEQLENLGYHIVQAANPRQALAMVADQDIELMLTDIVMPFTLNGIELVERARKEKPGLKALFMTGYASDTDYERAIALGPVLSKPFSIQSLALQIRQLLD